MGLLVVVKPLRSAYLTEKFNFFKNISGPAYITTIWPAGSDCGEWLPLGKIW